MTPGCERRAHGRTRFCRPCWYELGSAIRLFIQDARRRRLFTLAEHMSSEVAGILGRRAANDRRGAPAVAMCGKCERSAGDPVVASCTDPMCPFAMQAAA
jgi:hypothetical protein